MKKTKLAGTIFFTGFLFIACNSNWPYKPTPYVAPIPPPPVNGFVSKDSLQTFLGTSNAIFVYTDDINGVRGVYFVNFSDTSPAPHTLQKPSGRQDWNADSPLLSPDGKLVTYTLLSGNHYAAYVQKLDTISQPVLVSDKASDPHFHKDNSSKLWVVYADTTGILDIKLENLTANATFKQEIDSATGTVVGSPVQIADKPMYGGLSKDGQYLCTGYKNAYIFDIVADTLYPINSGLQTCNPSISEDPIQTDQMMFLSLNGLQNLKNNPVDSSVAPHRFIFIVDKTNTVTHSFDIISMFSGAKLEWQVPEWTNASDFFVALAAVPDPNSPGDFLWDAYCVKISTKEKIRLNNPTQLRFNESATPYLFIGSAQ